MSGEGKITKGYLILSVLFVAWLVICNVILTDIFKIHDTWPAFFICIFFFAYELNTGRLKEIFLGAVSGLIIGYTIPIALDMLTPVLGASLGFNLYLAVVLFIIIGSKPIAHTYLNPVTFTYALMCLINVTRVHDHIIEWGVIMLLGGALLVAGLLGVVKVLSKTSGK